MKRLKGSEEFGKTYIVNRREFIPIPELTTMFAEYNYDTETSILRIHIWLHPATPLRAVWEYFANCFGHEALKWTPQVEKVIDGHLVRGSIFIGLKSTPQQVHNVLAKIKDADVALLTQNKNRQ